MLLSLQAHQVLPLKVNGVEVKGNFYKNILAQDYGGSMQSNIRPVTAFRSRISFIRTHIYSGRVTAKGELRDIDWFDAITKSREVDNRYSST